MRDLHLIGIASVGIPGIDILQGVLENLNSDCLIGDAFAGEQLDICYVYVVIGLHAQVSCQIAMTRV